MFSHEGYFYNSYHRETTQKNNAVFPVTKPTKTQGQPNSFMHDMGPIFKLYRLLGHLPLHMDDSGTTTTFKVFSFLTLYTMLIQGGMVIGGVLVLKQRIEYIKKEKPQFEQVLIETTFLGALVTLFTSPFAHLLESSKKADYISCWADYQRRYEAVVGRPLHLNLRRHAAINIGLALLICSAVTSFPFLTLKEIRPWFAIPFCYSVFCCVMNVAVWHVSGLGLITAAKTLMEQLEHVLATFELGCEERIAEYRMLWLKLSKLTQWQGSSMGLTYGMQVIGYFVELVLGVYGLLANLHEGFATSNVVFVLSAVIFSSFIFVTCNIAQYATEEVGIKIQQKLQQLCHKIPRHYSESRREVRRFIKTIVENPPTVNFSGFVIVNRGLQTSLMSAMVTYLVVLIQFQLSAESTGHTNTTFNIIAT